MILMVYVNVVEVCAQNVYTATHYHTCVPYEITLAYENSNFYSPSVKVYSSVEYRTENTRSYSIHYGGW